MLTHAQVWSAIDRLAARAGLSASGLARRAGLDPTTFNKSKRITAQGRARWPSTESIAKALTATATPIDAFLELINPSGAGATAKLVTQYLGYTAAISTTPAFRSARAGTRSPSRRSATSTPTRSKCPAIRWSRPTATAT